MCKRVKGQEKLGTLDHSAWYATVLFPESSLLHSEVIASQRQVYSYVSPSQATFLLDLLAYLSVYTDSSELHLRMLACMEKLSLEKAMPI